MRPIDRGNDGLIRSAGGVTEVPSWVAMDVRNYVSLVWRGSHAISV